MNTFFVISGAFFWLFIAMFLISHLLDYKADKDRKKAVESAKKRAWKDADNWWIR